MATYKVPQDVEAEDKLLGPFSFRQFVYLMIAVGAGVLGFFLARVSPFLVIIPLPFFLAFGILALPLRKDQPMETYVAALIRFYLKPNKRYWDPDGSASLIEITNPKIDSGPQLKDFSGQEAATRLSFLSQVVDSQGWSTRGVNAPMAGTSLQDEVANDAMAAPDILDNTGAVSQTFDQMIDRSDQQHRQEVMQNLQQTITTNAAVPQAQPPQSYVSYQPQPVPVPQPVAPPSDFSQPDADEISPNFVQYSPYPTAMHQTIISPTNAVPQPAPAQQQSSQSAPEPATEQPSPDIIRLASNNDLSVATLAKEAQRLKEKNDEDGEVVISLR